MSAGQQCVECGGVFVALVDDTNMCIPCDYANSCDDCGDPVDEYGCRHDGRAFCRSCLHNCRECLAAIRDDWDYEMAEDFR